MLPPKEIWLKTEFSGTPFFSYSSGNSFAAFYFILFFVYFFLQLMIAGAILVGSFLRDSKASSVLSGNIAYIADIGNLTE